MLFISVADFFRKANVCTSLSREEELLCAQEMVDGNEDAKEKLYCGYFPHIAAQLKRCSVEYVTLELVYRCCQTLKSAIETYNFTQNSENFSHRLSWLLRQTTARYIVECRTTHHE